MKKGTYLKTYLRSFLLPLAFSLFCLSGSPAFSQNNGRDSSDISVAEFKMLLRQYVHQIPDLQQLWSNVNSQQTRPVYLSGGVLRGAIHYLKRDIDHHGIDQAQRASSRSAQNLLLQQWSDMDLVAPKNWREWVQSHLRQSWDVLSTDFMEDSTLVGGATLEKVKVSPWEVVDPDNALRDYLAGRLVFLPGSYTNHGEIFGNTRLAQALRFLRLSVNLPEAEITQESWRSLRQVSDQEWNSIRRGQEADYWVTKAVKKLYHAVNQDADQLIVLLHKANLLTLLAHHHFSLTPDEPLSRADVAALMRRSTLSFEEKMYAIEVLGRNTQERIQFLNEMQIEDDYQRQALREKKSLLRHIEQKFGGENHLQPNQKPGLVQVMANGVQVQVQGGRVLPNGAVQFDIPLRINGQVQCAQLLVKIGIGQPR